MSGPSRRLVGLGLLLATVARAAVSEPSGLWTGEMVGETPATLQGAQVIDLPALERLLAARPPPVLVDVGPAEQRPEGLPPQTLWRPSHRSLPGAACFPGGGRADLSDARAQMLLQRVATLAGGDKAAPIVAFCKPHCWGSWNAGKRLVEAGFTAVHWFPAGVQGWQEQHETTGVEADPVWSTSAP